MPGTTPVYAFPYPTQTDPVWQGAQQMQSLATAVEQTLQANTFTPGAVAPSAQCLRSNAQPIASGPDTLITWQAAGWDTQPGGQAQYSTNGLTCRVAGKYLIEVFWPWAYNNTGKRAVKLLKNGAGAGNSIRYHAMSAVPTWENVNTISAVVQLAVNDLLRLLVTQDSGAALNGGGSNLGSTPGAMSMTYLRP